MRAGDAVSDGTQILFDRGVLGVCVVALAAVAVWLLRREAARADDAQRQLAALHQSIRDDILPAIIKASEALVRVGELLPDVAAALRDHDRGRR